jgi:predicted MFS family arabinose efflux permease
MASVSERRVVAAAGLVQGLALITFPAISTVLTSAEYDLSSTRYGAMFLPQVVMAIAASLAGAGLARRLGTKRLYLAGLVADLVAMLLLLASEPIAGRSAAYPTLLAATAFLGAGFGLAVPALNTLTAAFHPGGVDRAVLVLNALLGVGTVLAPVLSAIFLGLGFWWGLPLVGVAGLVVVLAASRRLPLRTDVQGSGRERGVFPARFWLFAVVGILYGVCETMNGNWSQLDMTQSIGASTAEASLSLTAFWGMVTVGRVVFALLERRIPTWRTYHVLPFVLALSFVLIARLPEGSATLGIAAFGLAGLGCSALLPLTISFGQAQLTTIAASVAGGVIAMYQVGYGIAALGVGALEDGGADLPSIFGATAVLAVLLGVLAFAVARRPAAASMAGS